MKKGQTLPVFSDFHEVKSNNFPVFVSRFQKDVQKGTSFEPFFLGLV